MKEFGHIFIIVDQVDKPVPERRQLYLREGGDGLKVDETKLRCENTAQGVELLTDAIGYVCTRSQLNRVKPGCCNETDASLPRIKQYTCDRCNTNPPHCCDVFEHCVSCCMHPLNSGTRWDFLTHADPNHPVYSDPTAITVFQYCQYRCRTSSASVQHQNSYRSHRSFCYGIHRPLKVLPTVDSDSLHDEWLVIALAFSRNRLVAMVCDVANVWLCSRAGVMRLRKVHVTIGCRRSSLSWICTITSTRDPTERPLDQRIDNLSSSLSS